jgi:GxxExxY protein
VLLEPRLKFTVFWPGFHESVNEAALCRELELHEIRFKRQLPVSLDYKGVTVGEHRIDLLIEDSLIIELKACESLAPIHRAQCVAYLCATKHRVALRIKFNVPVLKDGFKRIIHSH